MPDSRLAEGSNFKIAGDIGLPVEKLLTTGANAHQRMMSGSSFAVPKLTAYVICIANAAPPNRLMGKALAYAVKKAAGTLMHRQQAMGCFYRVASLKQLANHIIRIRRPRSTTKSRCWSASHYRLNRLMLYPYQC